MKRPLAFSFITGALALSMAVGVSVAPAQAATAPAPINIPGSVLTGAFAGTANSEKAILSGIAAATKAFNPAVVAASIAKTAGTATVAQIATLTEAQLLAKIPWTKVLPLIKTVGTTAMAFGTYNLGATIGNGVAQALGVQDNGLVCAADGGGGFVSFIAGVDCDSFLNFDGEFVFNLGTVADATCNAYDMVTQPGYGDKYANFPDSFWVENTSVCTSIESLWSKNVNESQTSAEGEAYYEALDATSAMGYDITFELFTSEYGDGIYYTWEPNREWVRPQGYYGAKAYASLWSRIVCSDADGSNVEVGSPFGHNELKLDQNDNSVRGKSDFRHRCDSDQVFRSAWVQSSYPANRGVPVLGMIYSSGEMTAPTADPLRQLSCVIAGSDGVSYSALSAEFRETNGILPAPNCPSLPEGVIPLGLTVEEIGGDETHELLTTPATPEFEEIAELAPECVDGSCLLDLRKDGLSCFTNDIDCSAWFTDPNRLSTYSCVFGTHVMDLSECNVYSKTFNLEAQSTGQTFSDPATGAPFATGYEYAIGTDGETFALTILNPADPRQCFPTGWGALNPVEWVTKPVQCALQWAFIPKPAVLTETMTGLSTAWEAKAPAQLAGVIGSWAFEPPADSCSGLNVPLSVIGSGASDFTILKACPGDPLEPLAITSSLFIGLSAVIGAVSAVTRNFGGMVGYVGVKE
jgi:hypothetical protein